MTRWSDGLRRAGCVLATVLAMFVFARSTASAQTVESARRLYLQADFDGAIREFEQVLQMPGLSPAEAIEAHRYLSTLRSLEGDSPAARRHAGAAVALDPSVTPPEGAPPEATSIFDDARAALRGRRVELKITPDEPLRARHPGRIRARLEPPTEMLASELYLRCVAGSEPPAEVRQPPPEATVSVRPGEDAVHCRAFALTRAGATMLAAREEIPVFGENGEVVGEASGGPLAGAGQRDEDEGGSAWPWVAATGAAVAVAAVVIYFVVSSPDQAQLNNVSVAGWEEN